MIGLVGCTTMRPMAPVFSRPASFQVSPPSLDLKMPQPGEIVLREASSPVPAHRCGGWLGAIGSSPIEMQGWLSNTGWNDVPALVVFQIPPAAPATKNVFEGLGIPTTLDTRPPMLAGATLRQRNPASRVESSGAAVCAARGGRAGETKARTAKRAQRRRDMTASGMKWKGATAHRKKYARGGPGVSPQQAGWAVLRADRHGNGDAGASAGPHALPCRSLAYRMPRSRYYGLIGVRGYAELAPDLLAEIVSPEDRPADVLAKVADWLGAGTQLVWVIDPERLGARVSRR